MKNLFGLMVIFSLIAVIFMFPVMAENQNSCGENLTWVLDDYGVLTISGTGDMTNFKSPEDAPWYNDQWLINKIVISNGVTSIGSNAFCWNYEFDIDDDLTTCDLITKIEISNTVTKIGNQAFGSRAALTSINIPQSVTQIGDKVFENCNNLKSITFEGNAPEGDISTILSGISSDLTVYYYEDTTGWDSLQNTTIKHEALPNPTQQEENTADLSVSASTAAVGETINVTVTPNKTFSATDLTLNYDPNKLTYLSPTGTNVSVSDNGSVRFVDFGTVKSSCTFSFAAKATGTTNITLISAAFGDSDSAATENLSIATISNETVSVSIKEPVHTVVLLLNDSISSSDSVNDGEAYTFKIADYNEYFDYTITALMSGTSVDVSNNGNGEYAIENVTGNLEISVISKPKSFTVSAVGSGAEDAVIADSKAIYGKVYTLTVTENANYSYIVTAKINDQTVAVTGSNGSYTIDGGLITGNITITVTKTAKLQLDCSEYLTLGNSTSLWLITATTDDADGLVCTYNGNTMYWSVKYNAFCTLIFGTAKPTPTLNQFTLTNGSATAISYDGDVNMSGKLDANDAQFVYNMYNNMYSGITTDVTIEKYLRADVNGSKTVTTEDAAAVVNKIMNPNT